MSPIAMVAFILVGAHVVFCVLVTRRLLASEFYEPVQKKIQLAIAWFIPVLGVVLVWLFLSHERPREFVEQESEDDDVEESIFTSHDTSAVSNTASTSGSEGGE